MKEHGTRLRYEKQRGLSHDPDSESAGVSKSIAQALRLHTRAEAKLERLATVVSAPHAGKSLAGQVLVAKQTHLGSPIVPHCCVHHT